MSEVQVHGWITSHPSSRTRDVIARGSALSGAARRGGEGGLPSCKMRVHLNLGAIQLINKQTKHLKNLTNILENSKWFHQHETGAGKPETAWKELLFTKRKKSHGQCLKD